VSLSEFVGDRIGGIVEIDQAVEPVGEYALEFACR
jgi:hypothetical protein